MFSEKQEPNKSTRDEWSMENGYDGALTSVRNVSTFGYLAFSRVKENVVPLSMTLRTLIDWP